MGKIQNFIDTVDRALGSEQTQAQAAAQTSLEKFIADLRSQLTLDDERPSERLSARDILMDACKRLNNLDYSRDYQRAVRDNLVTRIEDELKRLGQRAA